MKDESYELKPEEAMTVKEGLEQKYTDYVAKNQDPYGHGVILATAIWAKNIDEGMDFGEVIYSDKLGITGFMAGCAAQAIAFYHPKGEEFRKFWNEHNGVEPEKDKGGVVNPAIITIDTGEHKDER